jgi:hypothetical protein
MRYGGSCRGAARVLSAIRAYVQRGKALGVQAVSFRGETPARSYLPTHALTTVATPVDVLANKDSMPKIREYLEWAKAACTGSSTTTKRLARASTVRPKVSSERPWTRSAVSSLRGVVHRG